MPIKVIKQGGDIPSNQVGVATNPRAENSLSELSFEGHPRQLNSNVYTNKLNDTVTGKLIYKPFAVEPFSSLLADHKVVSNYQKTSDFTDVRVKGDFIFVGCQYYNSGSTTSSASTRVSVGLVLIYKLDGTHWATIPSPAPGERSYYGFGTSLDYDPSVGKLYVGALDSSETTGGIVHIYDWDGSQKFTTSDWGTPTLVQASDRVANQTDWFGWIVRALDGKFVVSAAKGGPNGYGKVYVYNSDGSGEVAITPSGAYYSLTHVDFGCSIDIDGNATDGYKIAVGAHKWNDTGGSNRNGGAFVYNIDGTGEVMILPSLPSARRVYDYGHGVAIDVSAGKIFIASPDVTNTNVGYTNGRDTGMIAVFNLDGTGEYFIDPVFPTTPNPLPYSSWPANTQFGRKLGLNRNTQRLFVYHDRNGTTGLQPSIVTMDYDGSDRNEYIAYATPANATAPEPTGLYPFGKEANTLAKDGQVTVLKDDPTWDDNPLDDIITDDIYEPTQGPNASKRWCVTDGGSMCLVGNTSVYHSTLPAGGEHQSFGVGFFIKGLY